MPETYFGIGKLNFFLFLCIYILVIGCVLFVFFPAEYSLEGANKYQSAGQLKYVGSPKATDISGVSKILGTAVNVFWSGLTLDMPDSAGFPVIVRMFMVTPVLVLFIIVLIDILISIGAVIAELIPF